MGQILYSVFIAPLELFFTFILTHTSRTIPISVSIFFLSLCVQILSIPLYKIANKIEDKEKATQKFIKHRIFLLQMQYAGEELFHKTDELYKKYKYNPLLAFRASMSLFLVIPFFIAAYQVLNNNPMFNGVSFFGLFELTKPDHLLFGINILPIMMTVFNVFGIKYTNPKNPILDSSNFMLLALSAFFLIYLYNSSSALLLYWTMNNFIYLIKLQITNKLSG